MLTATKLGRKITYFDGVITINSHDPLITWPCKIGGSLTKESSARITGHCEIGGSRTKGGSARKRLSRH